jgi:hypothetical protein
MSPGRHLPGKQIHNRSIHSASPIIKILTDKATRLFQASPHLKRLQICKKEVRSGAQENSTASLLPHCGYTLTTSPSRHPHPAHHPLLSRHSPPRRLAPRDVSTVTAAAPRHRRRTPHRRAGAGVRHGTGTLNRETEAEAGIDSDGNPSAKWAQNFLLTRTNNGGGRRFRRSTFDVRRTNSPWIQSGVHKDRIDPGEFEN